MFRSLATTLFGLLALVVTASAGGTGWGTAYSAAGRKDDTGFNACQFGDIGEPWETMYAALPTDSFQLSDCGKCIKVQGQESGASGDWIKVMIVDACATCSGGDVDFSTNALEAITGFSWDRKKIKWEWTDCDGSSTSTASTEEASTDSSDSSNDEGGDGEELEGDLNGNGKLSKKEKKLLKKKKEQESRRLLRA
ncbi:hypothetical protein C2E20_4764 [Micractinium conductrix]|uniref:Barwin domain-containing protein n=1 Tax=Micractinium conductrix TaxID=554055 RepID=A0A2P6VD38_9CHLO|nr:hypothetical protein C2E20_4764 [Micractinium conductrix]|eukprot:PSC72013.1 hypothetical protein C2E20_4764 [Micractinium conductrix]